MIWYGLQSQIHSKAQHKAMEKCWKMPRITGPKLQINCKAMNSIFTPMLRSINRSNLKQRFLLPESFKVNIHLDWISRSETKQISFIQLILCEMG